MSFLLFLSRLFRACLAGAILIPLFMFSSSLRVAQEQANKIHRNFSAFIRGKKSMFCLHKKGLEATGKLFFFMFRIFAFLHFPRKLISFCIDFFPSKLQIVPVTSIYRHPSFNGDRKKMKFQWNGHFKSWGSAITRISCKGAMWQSRMQKCSWCIPAIKFNWNTRWTLFTSVCHENFKECRRRISTKCTTLNKDRRLPRNWLHGKRRQSVQSVPLLP